MTITIDLPFNLDAKSLSDMELEAREAIATRLYQEEKLSHGQIARFLGIGRGEVDAVLSRHGHVDEFSFAELAEQSQSLKRLRQIIEEK